MDYPVWLLTKFGGGFLIAIIATVHVFVAHFAVGGGLFLVLSEMKANRENSPVIMEYTRLHSNFFLLVTMVFGGVTGVAIWFVISVLAPGATSTLIHTFVFGWATEWVCFFGEIIALLLYCYSFNRLEPRKHLTLGWLYFIFAWLSLVLITGIVDFMLTPGAWLKDGDFWSGFFNPTFLPSVVFRTGLALMITGLFGFVTASFIKDEKARLSMLRYTAWWATLPLVVVLAGGWWYVQALPPAQQAMVLHKSYELQPYLTAFLILAPAAALGGLIMAFKMPRALHRGLPVLLLVLGFCLIGSFEYAREAARRPYLIHDYMYSNGIKKAEAGRILKEGYLPNAKWVKNKTVTPANRLEAGRELFFHQCSSCHSIGGFFQAIKPLTARFNYFGLDAFLSGMGLINEFMPPFLGTPAEREALAAFIAKGLHKKPLEEAAVKLPVLPKQKLPAFDKAKSEYVLLSWNSLGMHCISDAYEYWCLLPPSNDLYAQLIRRGSPPRVVSKGIVISYKVQPEFEDPAGRSLFWRYADKLFGKKLPANVGLSGNGLQGKMKLAGERGWFEANNIPVEPYPKGGGFNPYPLFTIEARDQATNRLLASTLAVAPTSTEMGCRNCHGGWWRVDGRTGLPDESAKNILALHDKISGTDLLAQAEKGNPKLCQSCHADPALGAKGKPELMNLSAAVHGLHAHYLTQRGGEACAACHPNHPGGATRCLRGIHNKAQIQCTRCHGFLEDHALSLLKHEQRAGKKGAARLMKRLYPRTAAGVADINPRVPWMNEPDCLNCHVNFKPADKAESNGFNTWAKGPGLYRMRRGDGKALACASCHNSPHSTSPSINPYQRDRDNLQALQYQGVAGTIGGKGNCDVCHVTPPLGGIPHHKNLVRAK